MESNPNNVQDSNKELVSSISPVLAFILRHPFEILAVAFTIIGTLGYAAGASFINGWNQAAGIPSSLFQVGPYEAILEGLSLDTPWLYGAVGLAMICVEIWLISCLDAWQSRRNSLIRIRRKQFEKKNERKIRLSLANAARNERKTLQVADRKKGIAYKQWKELGKRGLWKTVAESKSQRLTRNHRYIKSTVYLILQLACIFMAGAFYMMAKAIIVKQANSEGARQFAALYSAVTGTLPSQFRKDDLKRDELIDFACRGRSELWKYRAVNLDIGKSASAPEKPSTSYILQGTDKIFLLLSLNGTAIYSFGDSSFALEESHTRPISDLIKSCPK